MRGRTSIGYLLSERERKSLAILDLIRKKGPISRTDIARSINTNIVTVSNYIDNYIQKGLVSESGLDISSGGRKPRLVKLNSRAGFAIGVSLNAHDGIERETTVIICDLSGKEIAKVKSVTPKTSKEKFAAKLSVIINKAIDEAKIEKERLLGIGLGIGGERRGENIHLVIKEELERIFNLPVFTGAEVTFAAFGEKMLGAGENFENMLYMYSDIGCGIIIKGNIYCGAGGSAGELGLRRAKEEEFFCSSRGPCYLRVEREDFGISSQAKRVISEGVTSKIQKLALGNLENITLDLVIEAAREGDELAEELIENTAVGLGIRIAYLVNLFNPEVVVIGGGIEAAGSLILEAVRKTVKKWAFENLAEETKIELARLGKDTIARGAASIVMREAFIKA
jgi:predicted NBD/HSP70 family sugar kinase